MKTLRTLGCTMVTVLAAFSEVVAADVSYVGSATSGDIADAANWPEGQLPNAQDRAVFSSGILMPAGGLTLGADLAVKDLAFEDASRPLALDLGGHAIRMPAVPEAGGAVAPSITNELLVGSGGVDLTIHGGVITNLSKVDLATDAHLTLTNISVFLQRPNFMFDARSRLTVGLGAVLYGDIPSGDLRFPFFSGFANATFCIDGGRVVARTAGDNSWRRGGIHAGYDKIFEMKNGGRYDDFSPNAGLYIGTTRTTVFIHDGAEFTMTNVVTSYYDDQTRGFRSAADGTRVIVSNATFRASRFSSATRKAGSTNLFYDAVADFRYTGASASPDAAKTLGYVFSCANEAVTIVAGEASDFRALSLTFTDSSTNSLFRMTGGTADIGTVRMRGPRNEAFFEGGRLTAGRVLFDGATDGRIRFGAIDLTVNGTTESWGQGNEIVYVGTRAQMQRTTLYNNGGTRVYQDGGAITGGLFFASSDNTVVLTNRAYRYMPYRTEGLQFEVAKDTHYQNNRLVIDDSTLEVDGTFAAQYKSTASIRTDYGCVYTNCAGCAIEFRGDRPKMLFSSNRSSMWMNSTTGVMQTNSWWATAVLGSFGTNYVVGTESLPDPLAFRFYLPENGYAEAPLQGRVAPANDGRPLVPGGNMRIEVDASRFVQTPANRHVPLIRDTSNFTCLGFLMLDIDALNRNNRDYLPEGTTLRYVKERDAAGKVIAGRIDLVFRQGLVLLVK